MFSRLSKILQRLRSALGAPGVVDPIAGYDLWSSTYDRDDGNLLVALDEVMFDRLLRRVELRGAVVVDVGCGTGRHWAKILARNPGRLIGFDTSSGMLARLREKHPRAEAHLVLDHRLILPPESCDVLVSTLALAHMPDAAAALSEWARVVKTGGHIILTDLHPEAAERSTCTFEHQGRVHAVRLHVHSLTSVREIASAHQLAVVELEEEVVGGALEPYYALKRAPRSFERMRGVAVIYGLVLRKAG